MTEFDDQELIEDLNDLDLIEDLDFIQAMHDSFAGDHPAFRPATDAEFQSALDGDPTLRSIVGDGRDLPLVHSNVRLSEKTAGVLHEARRRQFLKEEDDLSKAANNELLSEQAEEVLEAIRDRAPGFSPVSETVDPAEDLSLARNNELLAADLDGTPAAQPEPAIPDPNDPSTPAGNPLLERALDPSDTELASEVAASLQEPGTKEVLQVLGNFLKSPPIERG